VEVRQTVDSILTILEIINSLKAKKKHGMLSKLDLSKAYDHISWDYLLKVLDAFGFSWQWISWIFSLISSPFFSIIINDSPSSTFRPTRGLRQGNPLSPFLFILAMEGLGKFLKQSCSKGIVKGLKLFGQYL